MPVPIAFLICDMWSKCRFPLGFYMQILVGVQATLAFLYVNFVWSAGAPGCFIDFMLGRFAGFPDDPYVFNIII